MYNGIEAEGDLNLSPVKRSDFNRYGIYLVTLRSETCYQWCVSGFQAHVFFYFFDDNLLKNLKS
jgi:hypothetical protein